MDNFNKKELEIFNAQVKYTKSEYLKLNKFHSYVLPRYLYISVYALIFTIFTFGIYLSMFNNWIIIAIIAGIVLFTAYIILLPYIFFNSNVKKRKYKIRNDD